MAGEIISAMEVLQAEPETISDHLAELKVFAATAASWAEAAATPSAELHVAVAIRRAVGELREYALGPSDVRLMRTRRLLAAARSTLDSLGGNGVSGEGPGLAVDAVRDRIDNLAANGSHLSCFSQIVLLDVVRLRLRRPIREKSNI